MQMTCACMTATQATQATYTTHAVTDCHNLHTATNHKQSHGCAAHDAGPTVCKRPVTLHSCDGLLCLSRVLNPLALLAQLALHYSHLVLRISDAKLQGIVDGQGDPEPPPAPSPLQAAQTGTAEHSKDNLMHAQTMKHGEVCNKAVYIHCCVK